MAIIVCNCYRWDFAGQSVYYNSHQFFLSSRAVYLLVWYMMQYLLSSPFKKDKQI